MRSMMTGALKFEIRNSNDTDRLIRTESAWSCHYRNGTEQRILDILNMKSLPQQCYVIFQLTIIQFL